MTTVGCFFTAVQFLPVSLPVRREQVQASHVHVKHPLSGMHVFTTLPCVAAVIVLYDLQTSSGSMMLRGACTLTAHPTAASHFPVP